MRRSVLKIEPQDTAEEVLFVRLVENLPIVTALLVCLVCWRVDGPDWEGAMWGGGTSPGREEGGTYAGGVGSGKTGTTALVAGTTYRHARRSSARP